MQVIDELTGKLIDFGSVGSKLVIVDIVENQLIYGYTRDIARVRRVPVAKHSPERGNYFENEYYLLGKPNIEKAIIYNQRSGGYFLDSGLLPPDFRLRSKYEFGQGGFPYKILQKRYEAVESFDIFKSKQTLRNEEIAFPHSELIKYTFGLEFETGSGYLPENIIIQDGLIPLRDGSISGLEYSTVVLQGNFGLNLLKQQITSLKANTTFNKECSLHIHMGGFPLKEDTIWRLYTVCYKIENDLQKLLPPLTFNTAKYKKSGKDYCKKLPQMETFRDLYFALVGRNFAGSFTQPHPQDPERSRKWQINTRYFWLNLINALCYRVNKTIEFRFLRPTYNFRKILSWIYIFNAILLFSESTKNQGSKFSLTRNQLRNKWTKFVYLSYILESVYPETLADKLIIDLEKLCIVKDNQVSIDDQIGLFTHLEDNLFDENEVL